MAPAIPALPATPITLADHYRLFLFTHIGEEYLWAAVPGDNEVYGDHEKQDCSGLWYAAQRHVWKLAGKKMPFGRYTAADYASMSTRIDKPSIIGVDFGIKRTGGAGNGGHVHHIMPFAGGNYTVDARATGQGVHLETLDYWTSPEVEWRRLNPQYRLDLGKLTDPNAPKEPPMAPVKPDTSWCWFFAHTGNNSGMGKYQALAKAEMDANDRIQVPRWAFTPKIMAEIKVAIADIVKRNTPNQGR